MGDERQQLALLLKDVPGQIKRAMMLALLLGLLLGINGILASVAAGTFAGRWIFYAVIIFLVYASNGVSLLKKQRFAYVFLVVLALLPLLGSFAGSVHLLALLMKSEAGANLPTLISVVATLQLLAIAGLLISLLSRPARWFVWRSDPPEPPVPEAISADPSGPIA